jgi:hypothetical protein
MNRERLCLLVLGVFGCGEGGADDGKTSMSGAGASSGSAGGVAVGGAAGVGGGNASGGSIAMPTGDSVQFLTHDGDAVGDSERSSAPNNTLWNVVLGLKWRRGPSGDWLDANGEPNGVQPYATIPVPGPGTYATDVTPLTQRWITSKENRGFYLRLVDNAFPVRFAGRTGNGGAYGPKLVVQTSGGTVEIGARANASWAPSSYVVISKSSEFTLSGEHVAIVQFELPEITEPIVSASLELTDVYHEPGSTSANGTVEIFEADPPRFFEPSTVESPQLGIASTAGSFPGFAAHPSVLFSDDFASPGPFDSGWEFNPERTAREGDTTYARGRFEPGANASASNKRLAMRGLGAGAKGMDAHYEELYSQYDLYLESDWGSDTDGIKIPAMGCQFGYWVETGEGYWQMTTGNGGSPGTGRLVQTGSRYDYEGHSVRLVIGQKPADQSAYADLFPIVVYPYNLDQEGPFPAFDPFPNVVLRKERWYTIELYMKQNSISGSTDALGNRSVANPDGEYKAWINGFPAYSRTDYRWRYHPDFGVEGFWLDFYHGGVNVPSSTMHYRIDRVSMATEYMGPLMPR